MCANLYLRGFTEKQCKMNERKDLECVKPGSGSLNQENLFRSGLALS